MNELLTIAQSYLDSEVAPRANVIDHDPGALRAALDGLCSRNLMALRRPEEFGGPALSEREFRQFQTMVAAVSGSLAFLQTQHQSAVSLISRSSNADLKDRYLPYMADGQKLVGIGFSQLRRKGPPLLKAQQVNGGYVLDGSVPWVTGLTFYHEFLIGATLPDGESLFGLVPFHDTENMKLGHVMKLSAMESPQTVSAAVSGLFLPDSQVVNTRPAGWIHTNDLINIILQGFFAIGCAQGGLDVLRKAADHKGDPCIKEAHEALSQEVTQCQAAMEAAQDKSNEDQTTDEKLRVRAWAIDLASRCAHAAVAATGGSANSVENDAQRLYREALVYTVSAQTQPIMKATLERLSKLHT